MKLRLNLSLRKMLLLGMAVTSSLNAYADTTLMAEGVTPSNLIQSNRFYDTGKGSYGVDSSRFSSELEQLYNQNDRSFDFLGDLSSRLDLSASSIEGLFGQLAKDGDTCWAQTAANLIQYWHSYYGVFYNGSRDLPYGYTYDKKYLEQLYGTLSLKLNLSISDNVNDVGGTLSSFSDWFMKGIDDKHFYTSGQGGYWTSDYNGISSSRWVSIDSLSDLTSNLLPY